MATYGKQFLSGSTNGKLIKVAATSTPGTTIHTAVSGTSNIDEVFIYAVNSDTTARKLTIEWGGVTSPDDTIEYTVAAEDGLKLIIPGFILQNGNIIRAFSASANVVLIGGYVNRITA